MRAYFAGCQSFIRWIKRRLKMASLGCCFFNASFISRRGKCRTLGDGFITRPTKLHTTMGNVGMSELLIIFLVALLVFGAKRIPDVARGLGQALREFRRAAREIADELNLEESPRPRPARPPVREVAAPRPPVSPPSTEENRAFDDQQPARPIDEKTDS